MNNDHIKCNHEYDCRCYPKYFKEEGYSLNPKSYKDVPGWINDAEFIYEEIVNEAKDGDYFVWPSNVIHGVYPFKGSGSRIMISWNSV